MFFQTSHDLRIASASSSVKFLESCLVFLGEGSVFKQGDASIRDNLVKEMGTGEIRLGTGKLCNASPTVMACERVRLVKWDTDFVRCVRTSLCPAWG